MATEDAGAFRCGSRRVVVLASGDRVRVDADVNFEHRCYLFLYWRGLQVSSLNEADPQPFGKIISSDPVRLACHHAVISQHEDPAIGVDAADAGDAG